MDRQVCLVQWLMMAQIPQDGMLRIYSLIQTSGNENNFGFEADRVQFYQDAFVYPYMDDLLTLSELEKTTLDGTYTSVNDIAWTVELSDRTDIFYGRDAVADTNSETGYAISVEEIIATDGDDQVDGGGGYNLANFSSLINSGNTSGVNFNMQSGEADWYSSNAVSIKTCLVFSLQLEPQYLLVMIFLEREKWIILFQKKCLKFVLVIKPFNMVMAVMSLLAMESDLLVGNGGEDILYLLSTNSWKLFYLSTRGRGG